MRWLIVLLAVLLVLLQYGLWVGEGSFADVHRLSREVAAQKKQNQSLRDRNKALEAEVKDLKHGLAAVEERARTDLGMIKKGEIFYQVVEEPDTGDDGGDSGH